MTEDSISQDSFDFNPPQLKRLRKHAPHRDRSSERDLCVCGAAK